MAHTKTKAPEAEVMKFDAEVGKVLQLMIHSLYTNKDIFLRELVSNASDACDKLRYLGQTDASLLKNHPGFAIDIHIDKDKRQITIEDTGIGMSRAELIENLGTIARSGTQHFLAELTQKRDAGTQDAAQLIGQFGVGFYASFMVADTVTVISQKAGTTESWCWSSAGTGEYALSPADSLPQSGTRITLHLKEGEDEFLDRFRLRHIIKTYSDHIAVPISIVGEEGKKETINSASALWTRAKSDITEDEYQQFYKNIAHAGDTPWLTLHNKNEGTVEFTNLLFIPSSKPFDLFHPDRRSRVKLYVKRVFISDEGIDLVPAYLRFLRGVVDSQDLPLNISRETLQHNPVLERIRKSIIKRILSELKKKASDDAAGFLHFWNNFGPVLKEGLCEGSEHRDAILEICRFYSTQGDALVTLEEYIARMKPGQKQIYYLTGSDLEKMKTNPHLEGFRQRGIEVLLFPDAVDDFWVNVVHEYQEKELCSITRSNINLDAPDTTEEAEDSAEEQTPKEKPALSPALEFIKTTLTGLVKDVQPSTKLIDSPACLSVAEGSMDMRMERFLLDQKQLAASSLKILEVNTAHPIVQALEKELAAGEANLAKAQDLAMILFEQSCIMAGEPIVDMSGFSRRLNQYVIHSLT